MLKYTEFLLVALCFGVTCHWTCAFVRPIWNLAHMVNSVAQVDEFLDLGANGIEADITFSKSGQAEYTYHGWPCDCFRNCRRWEYIDTYLQHVEKISSPGTDGYRKEFILLSLDLKLGSLYDNQKSGAMRDLAQRLLTHLWKNGRSRTKLRVLAHLPSVNDIPHVWPFLSFFQSQGFSHLNDRIGFEVYGSDSLDSIGQRWRSLNMTVNLWQSDGITNCLPRGTGRLVEILRSRNLRSSWVKKVFWWTVDKWSSIRSTLRLGVDGVMTNHPERVVGVLQENEFKYNYRLATHDDDPFEKLSGASYSDWDQDIPSVIENVDPAEEDIYNYR